MPNPFKGEYERTRAQKMRDMGVKATPCPETVAHRRYPPVSPDQPDPRGGLREQKLLSRDPLEAVRQLNTPEELPRVPTWASLPGHKD